VEWVGKLDQNSFYVNMLKEPLHLPLIVHFVIILIEHRKPFSRYGVLLENVKISNQFHDESLIVLSQSALLEKIGISILYSFLKGFQLFILHFENSSRLVKLFLLGLESGREILKFNSSLFDIIQFKTLLKIFEQLIYRFGCRAFVECAWLYVWDCHC
jgi:hypothetical protein